MRNNLRGTVTPLSFDIEITQLGQKVRVLLRSTVTLEIDLKAWS